MNALRPTRASSACLHYRRRAWKLNYFFAARRWRLASRRSRMPIAESRISNPCRSPFPVPCLPARLKGGFPISGVAFSQQVIHNGVCAFVHVKSRQIPSNSGQNRSKRRHFPSKRHQKGAHFVMPILTFCGWTPSGASARAVFAFRKAVAMPCHMDRYAGNRGSSPGTKHAPIKIGG